MEAMKTLLLAFAIAHAAAMALVFTIIDELLSLRRRVEELEKHEV